MVVPYGEARALLGGGEDDHHHHDYYNDDDKDHDIGDNDSDANDSYDAFFSSCVQVPVQLWPRDGRT